MITLRRTWFCKSGKPLRYAGQIITAEWGDLLWMCKHNHHNREAASACAEREYQKRKEGLHDHTTQS